MSVTGGGTPYYRNKRVMLRVLQELSTQDLVEELVSRDGIYYEEAWLYDDPVLNPDKGIIQIYDLRKEFDKDLKHERELNESS